MEFKSNVIDRGSFPQRWQNEDVLKNEPMFFNCDLDFAYERGGVVTRDFIRNLPDDWKDCNPVLDSRVHMLMKGWYPCIPGWHHDDVPRSTPTGQPNYINPEYRSEHLMGVVNGKICPTLFALGTVEVSDPDFNSLIYRRWDNEIADQLSRGWKNFSEYPAESGRYLQFNCDTFHTGQKAVENGWRWFIRLSRNTDRQKKITNEIRRQVQVYLDDPTMGW